MSAPVPRHLEILLHGQERRPGDDDRAERAVWGWDGGIRVDGRFHFRVRAEDEAWGAVLDRILGAFPRAAETRTAVAAPPAGAPAVADFAFVGPAPGAPEGPGPSALVLPKGQVAEEEPSVLLDVLLAHLNRLSLDRNDDVVHLHAGAVSADDRAVLLVGPSGAGKSTVTAALAMAGFAYLTDESVGVEASEWRVSGHAKPITLKTEHWPDFSGLGAPAPRPVAGEWAHYLCADDIDMALGSTARPGLVVGMRHASGERSALSPLTRARALELLLVHNFDAIRRPDALEVLAGLVDRSTCVELQHDDLVDAVELLAAKLAEHASSIPPPAAVRFGAPSSVGRPAETGLRSRTDGSEAPVIRAHPDVTGIDFGPGDGVVLHRSSTNTVAVVSGPVRTVWDLLDGSRTRSQVVADALAAGGVEPADEHVASMGEFLDGLVRADFARPVAALVSPDGSADG